MNNKLNPTQILNKAAQKYLQLKISKGLSPDMIDSEIRSDQLKAVVQILCEEINKVLDEK